MNFHAITSACWWIGIRAVVVGFSLFLVLQVVALVGGSIRIWPYPLPLSLDDGDRGLTVRVGLDNSFSFRIPSWTVLVTGAGVAWGYRYLSWRNCARRQRPWPVRQSIAMALTTAAIGVLIIGPFTLRDGSEVELEVWPFTIGAPYSDPYDEVADVGPTLRAGQVWFAFSWIIPSDQDQLGQGSRFNKQWEIDALIATIMFGFRSGAGGQYRVLVPFWLPVSMLLVYPVLLVVRPPRHPNRGPECVNCGYNLTGNTSGRCPECGTATNPQNTSSCQADGRCVGM